MEDFESLVQIVYAWPDSSWMYADEYSDLEDAWKGDDYATLSYPASSSEEEIEESIIKYFGGV